MSREESADARSGGGGLDQNTDLNKEQTRDPNADLASNSGVNAVVGEEQEEFDLERIFDMLRKTASSDVDREERCLTIDPQLHECTRHTCPYLVVDAKGGVVCSVTGKDYGTDMVSDAFTAGLINRLDENNVSKHKRSASHSKRARSDGSSGTERAKRLAREMMDEVGYAGPTEPCRSADARDASQCGDTSTARPSSLSSVGAASSRRESDSTSAARLDPLSNPNQYLRSEHTRNPSAEQLSELREVAGDVVDSLTAAARRSDLVPSASLVGAVEGQRGSKAVDKEWTATNVRALYCSHACRYVMRQTLAGREPSVNDLHDLCMGVEADVRRSVQRSFAHRKAREKTKRYIRVRNQASYLAVCLWMVVLRSPYMRETKRTGDGFRPFAAAVFMNMRRGIRLSRSQLEIIPPCKTISDALPQVLSQHKEKQSHANHLSAHRGAYTLHNSLSSIALSNHEYMFASLTDVVNGLKRVDEGGSVRP